MAEADSNVARWQFSLRTALLAMTFGAICLAIGMRHPMVLMGPLIVVASAGAILLVEKLVLSAATPRGIRVWQAVVYVVWVSAGMILIGTSCLTAWFNGNDFPDKYQTWASRATVATALGGVYCFYRAWRVLSSLARNPPTTVDGRARRSSQLR